MGRKNVPWRNPAMRMSTKPNNNNKTGLIILCDYCKNNTATLTIQMLRLASSTKTTHMYLDNKIDLCEICFECRY